MFPNPTPRGRKSRYGAAGIVALGVALLFAGQNEALAVCSSVQSCTKSDITAASKQQGCGLLFIQSRNSSCTGADVHGQDSCGPRGTNPPACSQQLTLAQNRAALRRWQNCEGARVQQQTAFAAGLNDVAACRQAKCAGYEKEVQTSLTAIETAITGGQRGHAEELRGVRTSMNACGPIIAAKAAQGN